ncbi:CPBP family intramembrane metalloprotease [Neobacillus notoginsengisoli]|uniref:CPBP family intramembrane metalloprotease n=1 Tax=Neobacillus notoginsengisoli TaxID=1578198 RepID=A0A417YT23_9BACI|nr:CPBP family intramembrane metalloprotease [Neobacillus notoginsengisoli]
MLQVIFFSIIPFLWWVIFWRKEATFFKRLGFKRPVIQNKARYLIIFAATIILLSIPSLFIIPLFVDQSVLATTQFYGQGALMLAPALIYAFLQTGLSEEILFRGFLTKRLIRKFGFMVGNGLQGLLFGLMHGVLFVSSAGMLGAIIIILITGMAGWLMGWINEKESDGSIISSWLLHGIVNVLASFFAMFAII